MNKFDEIVDYLWDHCKQIADNSFMNFLEVINSEQFEPQSEVIIKRINSKYNFEDYFKNKETLQELMNIKDKEPDKFYECVLAGSNWMNLMTKVADINIQGQIILNTEDLFRSFIIHLGDRSK